MHRRYPTTPYRPSTSSVPSGRSNHRHDETPRRTHEQRRSRSPQRHGRTHSRSPNRHDHQSDSTRHRSHSRGHSPQRESPSHSPSRSGSRSRSCEPDTNGRGPPPPHVVTYDMYLDTMYDIEQHKSVKWTIRDTNAPAWRMASRSRLIMRQLGPFVDAAEIMATGMAWNGGPPPEWDVPELTLTPSQKRELARLKAVVSHFEWLKTNIPYLRDFVPYLEARPDHIMTLGAFFHCHARQARNVDLNSLNQHMPKHWEDVTVHGGRTIQVPVRGGAIQSKDCRGFHAEWSARRLVARTARDEFDDDPETFCDGVRSGLIIIDHTGFPSFLYYDDDFDPDNLDKGLLRNDEYLKAYRLIFASPSSASRPYGTMSTHCVIKLYQLTEVTPGSLAYVAILLRNALSSSPAWAADDGQFRGHQFFDSIMKMFIDDQEWAYETISWWNACVFGSAAASGTPPGARRITAQPHDNLLEQQRARRRAQAVAATAQPAQTGTPSTASLETV